MSVAIAPNVERAHRSTPATGTGAFFVVYGSQVRGNASLALSPVVLPPSWTETPNTATFAGRSRCWPLHA